jgi:ribosomal protein S18 acetylase RimI-like enzyme
VSQPLELAAADLVLRPARVEDAPAIARMFLISSDGLAAYVWSRLAEPGQSLESVGAARYARTGTVFSFENCLLAVRRGMIVGMGHAYAIEPRGPCEFADDPVLAPYAELEEPGSLYVAGLAVDGGHRGSGVGTALLGRLEARARAEGRPRVSLLCFEQNARALAFYRRHGYAEAARRPIVPHPTLHYRHGDALLLVREL